MSAAIFHSLNVPAGAVLNRYVISVTPTGSPSNWTETIFGTFDFSELSKQPTYIHWELTACLQDGSSPTTWQGTTYVTTGLLNIDWTHTFSAGYVYSGISIINISPNDLDNGDGTVTFYKALPFRSNER